MLMMFVNPKVLLDNLVLLRHFNEMVLLKEEIGHLLTLQGPCFPDSNSYNILG